MFAKKINDLYLRYFHLFCSVCHQPYNIAHNVPYVICFRQHYCCSSCVQSSLFKEGQTDSQCPQCREPISKNRISKLRLFQNMQEYHYAMIKTCTQFQSKNQKIIADLNQTIQEICQYYPQQQVQQRHQILVKKQQQKRCKKQQKCLLEEAQTFFFQSNFQRAIVICKKMIQINPQISQIYYGFGGKQDFIGYEEQSIQQYYKTYKQQNIQRSVYDLLSLSLLLSSDFEQDKLWFQQQLEKHPNHYQLRFAFGLLLSNFNMQQESIQQFQLASKLNDDFDKADSCIAFEYYSKGDLQNAKQYSLNSLYKNPQNIRSLFIRAMTNQKEQMIINDLLELIDRSSDYLVPLHELGQIYFNKGQFENAIKYFKKCLRRSSYYNSARVSLSRCYIEIKEYEKAIEVLNDLIERQQDDQQVIMILAMANLKLKRSKQSHQQIKKCKIKYPSNHKVNYILADVYLLQQQYQLAIATYKQLLEIDEQNYQLIKLIAFTFLNQGDFYNAKQWLEQYLKHQPQDMQIRCNFAHRYFQNNMKDQALEFYLKCLQKDREMLSPYPKIIDIYNEKHMIEQALYWSQKWTEVQPENVDCWQSVSSISKMIGMKIKSNEWKPKKRRHLQ